jgi:branched-chain amino acid transport system ATP-binding protein
VIDGSLLEVRGLDAGYLAGPVLFGVDLEINAGELVALVGANGAGKSTLLAVISGLVAPSAGSIRISGHELSGARPERIVGAGVSHVPQGRRLFGSLSVEKNLLLGGYLRPEADLRADLVRVLSFFPTLEDKLRRDAGTLSGGEQQMVAIGRGLMARPKLLMIDEPSLGLAPKVIERVIDALREINAAGVAVLLAEQDVLIALELCKRGYVLETGRVGLAGPSAALLADERLRKAYLGL